MSNFEEIMIENLVLGTTDSITIDEISTMMSEKQEELDQEVKRIEQLDVEAQEKAMSSFVR